MGAIQRAAVVVIAAIAILAPAAAGAAAPASSSTAGTARPAAGVISTVAGGVGGPAMGTKVALLTPCEVAFGAGHLFIADRVSVRRLSPGTGYLTTAAGTGVAGLLGDGGLAVRASVSGCGVAVDHFGNVVIADTDSGNERVRVVAHTTGTFYGRPMTAGHIYTVAGNGTVGFSGDGGPATSAELANPEGVAVDAAGNLLIADTSNGRIRVVAHSAGTFYGQPMTAGDIYTVAGGGTGLGDGGPATSAGLGLVRDVAVDAAGNLLIADHDSSRLRLVAASTGTFYGQLRTAGDIYTVAGGGTGLGDGGPATSAGLGSPEAVAVDAAGNLLIADTGNNRVRAVAATTGTFYGQPMTAGDIYTVAGNGTFGFSGDGGPATAAALFEPEGVTVDSAGNLVISDSVNARVRVVAASTGTFYGQPMTAGDIYTVAGNGTSRFSGDGGPATAAQLNDPASVPVDSAGNLVIADTFNNRIRVAAASTGTFYGQPMTAGHIYTVAGNGDGLPSGDGGPATSAGLTPAGMAVDAAGNLLIADTFNARVVAASTGTFYGQPMTAGHIYTIAGTGTAGFSGDGGPATSAKLGNPRAVAADAAGNLLIADTTDNRIRVVAHRTGTFYGQPMTAGHIYTLAGNGKAGFSGDGGPATSAGLHGPGGVAVDPAGNLLIADSTNNRIRVVAHGTGTFYGQPMTAGHIYTIAGHARHGFSGDSGPATSAGLNNPTAVTMDAAGNLLIADSGDQRIRMVTG
jgi:NHL repeat-containing protein